MRKSKFFVFSLMLFFVLESYCGPLLPPKPIIHLAYLELCDSSGHVHITVSDENLKNTTGINIQVPWYQNEIPLIKTDNGWEIELYHVPMSESEIHFLYNLVGSSPSSGEYQHKVQNDDILTVSKHLDKSLVDFQKNYSNSSITTYFCGKQISTVELLAFFQKFLRLSNTEICILLERYNTLITIESTLQISYRETYLLCQQFEAFLRDAIGNVGSECLCNVIATNRAAYFLDDPGSGVNEDGCNDIESYKDCRQFEFESDDDDLLVSYGRLGAAKSATLAMQYDGCDDSPNGFQFSIPPSGAAIAFRSVCIDPITLSANLENCVGCVKEISLSYSYLAEGEIYAHSNNNIACLDESIEITAEDWAFLLVTIDSTTTVLDTGAKKFYVACNVSAPSLDSLITKGSDIVEDLSGLVSDFSFGGLASAASAVTSFLMDEVFVTPCQSLLVDNYTLLAGNNKKFELQPGGYFEAVITSGTKFAAEEENVGKGYVSINGDFYMLASFKTKANEDGEFPSYCTCEKIGAYVLGSLKEETPDACDIHGLSDPLPIDMDDIFIYNRRTIQQLQNIAGVKLGLDGTWDPKWQNNGGCCSAVDLNCLAQCAYITEPCPGFSPRIVSNYEEKADKARLIIYPNPADGIINFMPIKGTNFIKVVVKDLSGRKMIESNDLSTNPSIDISKLISGIYILEVINQNDETFIQKFVKI